jgi:hypothetical protein
VSDLSLFYSSVGSLFCFIRSLLIAHPAHGLMRHFAHLSLGDDVRGAVCVFVCERERACARARESSAQRLLCDEAAFVCVCVCVCVCHTRLCVCVCVPARNALLASVYICVTHA